MVAEATGTMRNTDSTSMNSSEPQLSRSSTQLTSPIQGNVDSLPTSQLISHRNTT